MVAPVDSMVKLEVEGETFILRLNFRTLALLEKAGLDPFTGDGFPVSTVRLAMMCLALTIEDHPSLSDAEALAIVVRSGVQFTEKVKELFENFGGVPVDVSTEGKAKPARRTRRKASA